MAATAEIEILLTNGQQAGKTINELTAQSVKLAREIKKLEIGSEAWVQASEDFKLISAQLKNVKKEAFDTAEAQNYLNSMFADMVPYQKEFQNLATGVKGVGTALKATTSMAQLLKVALAATGIGLLVVALGSLVAWLSKTQKGMDFVSKVTASLGAAFNVVIERVATFGEGMVKLLSGDFAGSWDSMKKAVSGFGAELAKETKATWENTAAMQALNREQALLDVNKAKSRAEIEKLKKAAEDQSQSETTRLAAAQKAYEMEQAFLNQSISLQERRIKLIEEENAKKGITLTDEDKQAQYDAEIELANMQEESFTKQTELQNKINELRKAGAIEAKKLKEEEFLVVSENLEKEFAALEAQLGREVEATQKAEEQKAALREEAINGRMEQLDRAYEMEQLKLQEQFFTGQITEQEMKDAAFEQEKAFLQQRLTELALLGSTEVAQYQQIYTELARLQYEHEAEKTENLEENEKKRKDLLRQGLSTAAGVFAGLATLLNENSKARKKNFAVIKAVQAAEIAANTTTEISNIFVGFSKLGIPGQILAVVQAAIAAARGASAISKINTVQIQGGEAFAEGGVVKGPSHKAGGIKFSVGGKVNEMEGDEIILTKGVYQNPLLRALASDLNVMGGGRSFALGGPVMQDRPMVNTSPASLQTNLSQASAPAVSENNLTNQLLGELVHYSKVTAEKPPLVLKDVKEGIESLYEVEQDARF